MFDLDKVSEDILENLNENSTSIELNCSPSSPRSVGDAVQEYLAESGLASVLSNYNIDVKAEF